MPDTPLNPDALEAAAKELFLEDENTAYVKYPEWDSPENVGKPVYIENARAVVSAYLAAALPEVTSVEELDQLPQGAVIMATGGQWNPDYPELFLKAGYAHAPWLALDPSDRDDGENLESSGAVLKWRCDGSARVLYRPSEKP